MKQQIRRIRPNRDAMYERAESAIPDLVSRATASNGSDWELALHIREL